MSARMAVPAPAQGTPHASRSAARKSRPFGPSGKRPAVSPPTPKGKELAPEQPLDCRTLIDECLTHENWLMLFQRLLEADPVEATGLLLRFRFGTPRPNDFVRDQPLPLLLHIALPDKKNDLESTPRTADKFSPQPGE